MVEEGKSYFLTSSAIHWLPLSAVPALAEIVIDSLNFLQQQERITIHAWVLMETHLHPEEWRYSSARDYSGKEGLVDIERLG